jgi:hypothetical protein
LIRTCIHVREQDWFGNEGTRIPIDGPFKDANPDFLTNCLKINETTAEDEINNFKKNLIVFHGRQYLGFMIYIVGYLFTKLI